VTAVESRPPAWPGSSAFTQVAVLTRRAALDYLSDPRVVILGLIQPVIVLFVVVSAFSEISLHMPAFPPGISYFQYVLPSVLVDGAIVTALQTGTALVDELRNGVVARLRSLPILPGSILIARSFSGLIRTAVQAVIVLVLAQLTHGNVALGGLAGTVAAVALTMLIGWGLGWLFITASIWLRRADAMLGLGFVTLLPLTFASSAYVPVSDMPTALRAVAHVNPITYAINAERAIFLKSALGPAGPGVILPPIVISVVIGIAGAYAAIRLFRRPLPASPQ
jgi:ABC-2 type transport system permease protein